MSNYEELRRLEEALEMADREWRATFDAMSDAIWVLDADSRIVRCNTATTELFGKDPREVLGRHCWEVVHATGGPIDACPAIRMRQTLRRESTELEFGKRWFNITVDPILDAAGELSGIVHVMSDITERKGIENALKASETKYRRLHNSMIDAFVTIEMDGTIRECNESYRKMLGYEPGELEQSTCEDLTPEKWRPIEAEIIDKQLLTRGYSDVYEKEYVKKDSTVFPVELRAFVINDDTGAPCGMWAIVRDITERKRAEDALRESEERYRRLVDLSPVAIFVNVRGKFAFLNAEALALLGASTPEDMIGKEVLDFIGPEHREIVRARITSMIEGKAASVPLLQESFLRLDGSRIDAEVAASRIAYQGEVALLVVFRDITKRIKSEAALRESEETYRNLVETTDTGYLIGDTEGRVVDANAEYVRLTGRRTLEEILGHSVLEWTAEYDLARNEVEIRKCAEAGMVRNLEIDYVSPDGSITPTEINGTVIETRKGPRILTLCRDISERRRAEESLRLRGQIIEQIHDSVITTDLDGRVTSWNKGAEKLFGYSAEEALGRHVSFMYPEEEHEFLRDVIGHLKEKDTHEAEVRCRKNSGPDRTRLRVRFMR